MLQLVAYLQDLRLALARNRPAVWTPMVENSMSAFMVGWASPSPAERKLQTLRHHGGEPCHGSTDEGVN